MKPNEVAYKMGFGSEMKNRDFEFLGSKKK